MHASLLCSVQEGTGQLNYTCKRLLDSWEKMCISGWELSWLPRRFAQFLGRTADCYPYLRKFWAKQPCWGKLCNSYWECWLEESRNSRAQQATNQDCTISREKVGCPLELHNFLGELLNLKLDQVRVNGLWGEWIKLWPTCRLRARKTLKLVNFDEARQAAMKIGREAPKRG